MADWSVKGTYAEVCTCEGACPCVYAEPPTGGACTALVGWRVEDGHDGDVSLKNLNVALALYAPGRMTDGDWRVALYLDDRAGEAQRAALQRIFSGAAGGHPANFAPLIAEVTDIAPAAIKFEGTNGRYQIHVGSIADAEFAAIEGQGGQPATISGHPFAVSPGFHLTVAKSSKLKLRAGDIACDVGGRTAYYAPFAYEG